MKHVYKLLMGALILSASCSEDESSAKLSDAELLRKSNWIIYSVVNPGGAPEGEPDMMFNILRFNKSNYEGADFTGQFYLLGGWSIENNILTMGGDEYPVSKLTATKLVYESLDGRIVTRVAIDKDL